MFTGKIPKTMRCFCPRILYIVLYLMITRYFRSFDFSQYVCLFIEYVSCNLSLVLYDVICGYLWHKWIDTPQCKIVQVLMFVRNPEMNPENGAIQVA